MGAVIDVLGLLAIVVIAGAVFKLAFFSKSTKKEETKDVT